MHWTKDLPTTPWWYWWRGESDLDSLICWVSTDGWAFFIQFAPMRVKDMSGEWSGPILEPTDVEEARG